MLEYFSFNKDTIIYLIYKVTILNFMNENVENKVKGIVGLYNFYKGQMNTVQRVGLLSLWV